MATSNAVVGEEVVSENIDGVNVNIPVVTLRNPLLCGICHDYYNNPCLLSCYHTFCARCLRGPHVNGKVTCPICGQTTQIKEGEQNPPTDQLMHQLVELANCENPPCANCEKRDKTSMFFCTTCGQALCPHCREHTHKAKMFSSHEVVHMSNCNKDIQRRCPSHGEQYIVFSPSTKCMLCPTCFRDSSGDIRLQCVDIDTAWQQATMKIEHATNSICQLQVAVRDGLLGLKSQLDELKHSFDIEKQTLNNYCQGIQEAVNKTQSSILLELHQEFDTKDRMVRMQLLSLGSALPVLQMHLGLCTAFTSATNKYQFLELVHLMLDRLSCIVQLRHLSRPPLINTQFKSNHRNEFTRILKPFINALPITPKDIIHDQMQSQQHQQESQFIQHFKPRMPGSKSIYETSRFKSHCTAFDTQLQQLNNQLKAVKERLTELHRDIGQLRTSNTSPLRTRYENITTDCRLLEQQLEHQQMELERLRNVFDTLWEKQSVRIELEKEIFYSQMNNLLTLKGEVKQVQSVAQQLEPFIRSFITDVNVDELSTAISTESTGHKHLQTLLDHLAHLKMQEPQQLQASIPTKEYRHQRNSTTNDNVFYTKDSKEVMNCCRTACGGSGENALDSSGNIVVYETKMESKRGVLSQLIEKARTKENRKKSPSREEARERNQTRRSRKSPENNKSKTPTGYSSSNKVRSLYRTLKGGGCDNEISIEALAQQSDRRQQHSTHQDEECDYQRISEASSVGDVKKRVQAQIHPVPGEGVIIKNSDKIFDTPKKDATDRREKRRRASCESLSTTGSGSRRSSIVDGTKPRSWETFPRLKSKHNSAVSYSDDGGVYDNGSGSRSGGPFNQLKKVDSFEGHEEAVRTLVAAVQETRSQLRQHHFYQHRHHRKSKTN